MAQSAFGYKEKVTDEELIRLIELGVTQSIGDWINSSDLAQERLKSTYEFAGLAQEHLAPQGVSAIVDSSTTETVEAYTAILTDLFLNNGKLARFVPYDESPGAYMRAKDASMVVNYALFKQNNGWKELQTWIKSALLWKNGIIRWDYVEDYDYVIEEYDRISQGELDEILAGDGVEIIGELEFENSVNETIQDPLSGQTPEPTLTYLNVRLRKTIDKSRVKITNIPPENFRITRDATSIDDAWFVGIQTDMTRSEIRKMWPGVADAVGDWDELGPSGQWTGNTRYSEDISARKIATGQEYWQGQDKPGAEQVEANREVTVTECWMRVDRDGDGIAELKRFIIAGERVLFEEDVDMIPLASLCPIDVPFEFFGISIADFTRSSTLASTAILRGFVENTYLTNYAPKLADPNVVDFSALQSMKPKTIIPTNGNPAAAVQPLPAETISTGTVPLLEHLQTIKEQATGMSKAAQGLNDQLYVSGNSEAKLAAVQSASQKRIQHIARRFAETGMKRLIKGVYRTIRKCSHKLYVSMEGVYKTVDMQNLPMEMDCEIFLDIGENSNQNMQQKLGLLGSQILPALNEQGAGMVIKTHAPAVLATKLIEAMGLDSNDYLEDYTTDEFKQRAQQAIEEQTQKQEQRTALEDRKLEADAALAESNVKFTDAQTKNTVDDNAKQLAVSIDKHFQEWTDLSIKAVKEGAQIPPRPDYAQIVTMARSLLEGGLDPNQPPAQPQQPMAEPTPQPITQGGI